MAVVVSTASPLLGLTLTLAAYAVALAVHRRFTFLHPLLVTAVLLIAALLAANIPLPDYRVGGDILVLLLGPATVALAVPLYKHGRTIQRYAWAVCGTLLVGCVVGVLSSVAIAVGCRASKIVVLSVMSKSVTTPISMEVTRGLGGSAELAAVVTVLSGLWGAVVAPGVLRACGLTRDFPVGMGMGLSAHGIGTASALRVSEVQGMYAGLAMALNGIVTAAILTPLSPAIQQLIH